MAKDKLKGQVKEKEASGKRVMTFENDNVFAFAFDGVININGKEKPISEWADMYSRTIKFMLNETSGGVLDSVYKVSAWIGEVRGEMGADR